MIIMVMFSRKRMTAKRSPIPIPIFLQPVTGYLSSPSFLAASGNLEEIHLVPLDFILFLLGAVYSPHICALIQSI